ncbi:uncharacterized protein LOC134248625 [Saccostrea cucullata]|uniref:uncharacterized protein LOC134248625 n=1 Tax=Saccostrea cuccullata TaxID=36930 RepID=UPI002ED541BA
MTTESDTRDGNLRVYSFLCAADFCLFFSYVLCLDTANEYGRDQFRELKFPNRSLFNISDDSFCETNTSSQRYEERKTVQKLVSEWDVYISIAQGVQLILSSMLFSPLSDSIGRRSFLFAGSLEGFSGSWFAQLVIAMTVVSDLTKAGKSRSYLITVFSFMYSVGFSLGTFSSAYVVAYWGYEHSMAIPC